MSSALGVPLSEFDAMTMSEFMRVVDVIEDRENRGMKYRAWWTWIIANSMVKHDGLSPEDLYPMARETDWVP